MRRRLFGVLDNCLPCPSLGEQVEAGVGANRLSEPSVKRSKKTLAVISTSLRLAGLAMAREAEAKDGRADLAGLSSGDPP